MKMAEEYELVKKALDDGIKSTILEVYGDFLKRNGYRRLKDRTYPEFENGSNTKVVFYEDSATVWISGKNKRKESFSYIGLLTGPSVFLSLIAFEGGR